MEKQKINLKLLLIISLIGLALWYIPAPTGLKNESWHLLIVFLLTILGIISSPMPMGPVTLTAIAVLVLTKTLPLNTALSGFSSPIAWLVVMAFFIARGFINTNLGKRIAFILISKFGSNSIGLSYSLIFTELLLAPMIPSTSARGGGIIYPIAKSLSDEYSKSPRNDKKTAAFLISTCFHTNVICCALFLTSMAGNPLIVTLADAVGVKITWTNWATATIVPGLINLILLPFVVAFVTKPNKEKTIEITESARIALKEMGSLSRNEIIMLFTFLSMLILWIFGSVLGIDATTAALLGFLVLIMTNVLKWSEVLGEKGAWETLIWFAILLMLSDNLTKFGISAWVEDKLRFHIGDLKGLSVVAILGVIYFYVHYLFASITAHVTVMYTTFLLVLITVGVPPLAAGLGLAILSNLSGGLTHYGINSGPIYFGSGYFTTKEWLKVGFVVATANFIIWLTTGGIWWKMLGWW
jgi:DASS family divalent anion:Na+ symporter